MLSDVLRASPHSAGAPLNTSICADAPISYLHLVSQFFMEHVLFATRLRVPGTEGCEETCGGHGDDVGAGAPPGISICAGAPISDLHLVSQLFMGHVLFATRLRVPGTERCEQASGGHGDDIRAGAPLGIDAELGEPGGGLIGQKREGDAAWGTVGGR
jgi:hypothetical protein